MQTHLILASSSEWRAKLLRQAGFDFEVVSTDIDEETDKQTISDPESLVQVLAEKKAEECRKIISSSTNSIILSADTVIFVDGEIVGKPKERYDAKQIIQKLSGKTHDIWTGVCIIVSNPSNSSNPSTTTFAELSLVTIRHMTDQEIESYLDTNEWIGKAGAYQVQKTISRYITQIKGSYSNIIGLPIMKIMPYVR